jgi:hypothetical protein
MAKAKIIPGRTVKRLVSKVETTVIPGRVLLGLTPEEASVLKQVCRNIGGHPDTTARGHMDAIDRALTAAGVEPSEHPRHAQMHSLYFV